MSETPAPGVARRSVLIVGAGFSGAVVARQLAEAGRFAITVIDQRNHIGGNCHTARDPETGVMIHHYGPHIFHTDRKDVWDYVRRFGKFVPYIHRVKAHLARGIFPLPICLATINQFFGKKLTPSQAQVFLQTLGDGSIQEPANFEEQALKFVGRELYEAFFYGYTRKHWGCEPRELPASILRRLPIRFDYNDAYHDSTYQGIPKDGYTAIIESILNHPAIEVKLETRFTHEMSAAYEHTLFTGPIDAFYNHRYGRLGYRTVYWESHVTAGDYQGCVQMNYPELAQPYTREIEYKHFTPWETHEKTNVAREFSKETGDGDEPYYPKRLAGDRALYARYEELAQRETNVSFLGRLATYRYLDMHQVIAEALDFSEQYLARAS